MQSKVIESKYHWYDGWFYDKVIAPNQKELFEQIIKLIEPDSEIIDVGCGTGFFSFTVADRCKSALGVDLSKRNIDKAMQNLSNKPTDKLSFRHTNLQNIITEAKHFDYAILTYVIHEVNEEERIPLLKEIAQVADKIIIGDYLSPQPANFSGTLTKIIEYIAGSEHYANFRNYQANGGIPYLAEKAGLTILSEIKNNTNHITVLANNTSTEV
ncbi:MAG: class I SAM-dependent methyltransferase [Paludibacter sp.]|nr:class I SAM-dependent methyltransferase [Paludibacter sp.]